MFATATYTVSDPDVYAALIRGAEVGAVIAGRGDYKAEVTRVDLDQLWMQRGKENLARIFRAATPANRVIVSFPGPAMSPTNLLAQAVSGAELAILKPGLSFSWRTFGASDWASMSLPTDHFVAYGASLVGRDLIPSDLASIVRPPPSSLSRLHRLHQATVSVARTAPDAVAHPDAVHAREQSLIQAAFACMAQSTNHESVSGHQRARVLARFEAILEANPDTNLFIPEICKAINVSGRTLRNCCAEYLGMSPLRYLHLRRMHLVRRALLEGNPASVTVTEIATRFGFWELGRFAGRYYSLFGEFPSATLRRQLTDRLPMQKSPFGRAVPNVHSVTRAKRGKLAI